AGYPMVLYPLAVFHDARGERDRASQYLRRAYEAPPQYCFPARLEELQVLHSALQLRPDDAKAHYYLGNLLYDKRRYAEAIQHWERSCELEASFSIPWRNLGIARYNVQHDAKGALSCYRSAMLANPGDGRLLYEMDQLQRRLGLAPERRLTFLEQHRDLVARRDDLT